jgi:ferredoxin-NADP reductase
VKGLVVAGQDAWGSGVVGALAGGLLAANAVLKPRQLGTMWRAIRAPVPARDQATAWRGYLRVSGIDAVTPTIRRIRLSTMDDSALPFSFDAGQYLKVDLPVAVEPVERSYSLSSGPGTTDHVEIGVKRDPAGLGSTFLHDELEIGQALPVSGPHGEFTWKPADGDDGTLLLIAGGVGITPLISVLEAAADAGHPGRIVLLAGCRTEDEIPYRSDVERLAGRLPGLEAAFFVSRPGPGWVGRRGRIDQQSLRPYAVGASRVHLCGPASMMQDLIGSLTRLGIPREAIHTEAFVSGNSRQTRREKAHAVALAAEEAGITRYTIGVRGEETAFPCRPGETLLDAANGAGMGFPQSCGEGACGTCRVRIVAGTYETDTRGMFSVEEIDAGWRLACQTLPTDDLVVNRP